MRGAAVTLSDQARRIKFRPDLVLASDMIALAEFMALYGNPLPSVLYMHENQLSYPAPGADQRDIHFGFTNITSCLAASQIIWNSAFQRDAFVQALPGFLAAMPDQRPKKVADKILAKSVVIPPGVDLEAIDREPLRREGPPLIVWNHRWESDKRPEEFFDAIRALADTGVDFHLAILGESFQTFPEVFLTARDRFGDRILNFGYVERRLEYVRWLRRSSVSVSTAAQENFGIAAVEAAYAGAFPLWPNRLSYPELLPASLHEKHLYDTFDQLVLKLESAVKSVPREPAANIHFREHLKQFGWNNLIGRYDTALEKTAGSCP